MGNSGGMDQVPMTHVRRAGIKHRACCASPWFIAFWLVTMAAAAQVRNPSPDAGKSESARLDEAKALVREGRIHDAEPVVREYLRSGKGNEEAHGLLGLILYQESKPADSLAEFTLAAQFATPTPAELTVVALDYVLLKDLASADKWMTVSVARDPENPGGLRYLGGIKYSENRFAEAIQTYNRYLALRPRDVLVEDAIGRSLEGLARDDDAASAYRQAMDWQANAPKRHHEPLLHLGALLLRKGKAQEALPLLADAEAIAPSDGDVHEELGVLWTQTGELEKAQSELEKALSISPGNSHLHWLLASVYRREGQIEKANREIKEYSALLGSHSSDKMQ
jgi:Flp pilus assembly protein TadD